MRVLPEPCPSCAAKLYTSHDGDTVCGRCTYRVRDSTFARVRKARPPGAA